MKIKLFEGLVFGALILLVILHFTTSIPSMVLSMDFALSSVFYVVFSCQIFSAKENKIKWPVSLLFGLIHSIIILSLLFYIQDYPGVNILHPVSFSISVLTLLILNLSPLHGSNPFYRNMSWRMYVLGILAFTPFIS